MSETTYVTRSGDTWDQISLRVSGAERYMDAWLDANPTHNYVVRFDAGVVLQVPTLPASLRPVSLPPWRVA